jgi:hypothetical protein
MRLIRTKGHDMTHGTPLIFAAPERYPDAPGSGDPEAGLAHTVESGTRDATMAEALRRLSPEHRHVLLECHFPSLVDC